MSYDGSLDISLLNGKTLTLCWATDDEVHFETTEGKHYKLYHSQDCCEHVYVESIVGLLTDLIGSEILQAEDVSNEAADLPANSEYAESYTWTFYKLATIKGSVTIRFYGSSNGYYSEDVSFVEID